MISEAIARQLRRPSGLLGRLVGRGMAWHNEFAARWTLDLLDVRQDSHVLEIGFGPGVATEFAWKRALRGHVSGIDYSEAMVEAGRRRNAAALPAGLVDLAHGDVRALPYAADSFDRAFAIHSIYFWSDPVACLREVRRVMRTDGLLAITIQPRRQWPRRPPADVFTLYEGSEVADLLRSAGFRDCRVEAYPEAHRLPCDCILASK
ncbi:MAG: class I SAM-dependent methyltransferase [Gemmatimonadetes bacterium]|nr:class I SAM-dependent methyltransferase [Gemmatimonadota bacterium]